MATIKITTPLTREAVRDLKAGDSCLISGVIYTARDAAHKRLCELAAKGQPLPLPFLVTEDAAMAIYSAPGLDAAAEGTTLRMRSFLIDQVGMQPHEAGMLLSLAGELRICQCVDPNKTCRMVVALSLLDKLGYTFP